MTDDELRDLDARVHREILGLPCERGQTGVGVGVDWCQWKWCGIGFDGSPINILDAIPYYTTSIEAAWAIVEHLGELGFNVFIEWKGKGRGYEHTAEVSVNKVKGFTTEGHGVGPAPLAICTAALQAIATTTPTEGS